MSKHGADSQPRNPDAGMDAFIRHLETRPELDRGQEEPANATPEPTPAPAPTPTPPEPIAAQEQAEVQVKQQEIEKAEALQDAGIEDPLVPVVVNGVEEEVPLSELMRGYSRNSDYTRKTQALAEERRAMEAERSQLMLGTREAVERMSGLANQLAAELSTNQMSQEDLANLRREDPAEYAATIADQQRKRDMLAQAQAQASQYEQVQQAQRVQYERSMLAEKAPDFASDFEGTYAALGRWVTSPEGGNISPQDWNREYDHNRILMAYHAWKASEQGAAASDRASSVRAKVANLPRIRPTSQVEAGDTEQANYATALERMQRTGTTRDIAAALQARTAMRRR